MKTKTTWIVCISIGLIAAYLWLWGVNDPYVGSYNTNNNYLSLAAKNYLRFGYLRLKFFPTYFAGQNLPFQVDYYLHHPILIYLLVTIPFTLFGFQNWVVHVVPFIFAVGSLVVLYEIGAYLWNRSIGIWAVVLAALFPMSSFYWKYIFFEQICLFFNLLVVYVFLKYIKEKQEKYLKYVFLFSLFSMLADWGGLYLLVPLTIFFFSNYRQQAIRAYRVHVLAVLLGSVFFLISVAFLKGSLWEMFHAIYTRSYSSELLSLTYWPFRLILVTFIRIALYFTPFVFLGLYLPIKFLSRLRTSRLSLQDVVVLLLFVLGVLNLVVLPTASWGHSYFLYYLIPFFALTGGFVLSAIEKKKLFLYCILGAVVLWTVSVNFLKLEQLRKQYWKYDVALEVNKDLSPYETVGVTNFAGDVFENYFLHPSQPMVPEEVGEWLVGEKYARVKHLVFTCEGNCTSAELHFIDDVSPQVAVLHYRAGYERAWFLSRLPIGGKASVQERVLMARKGILNEGSVLFTVYRFLRDRLSAGQI